MLALSAVHSPSDRFAWTTPDAAEPAVRAPALPDDPHFACELQVDEPVGATRSEQDRLTPYTAIAKALSGGIPAPEQTDRRLVAVHPTADGPPRALSGAGRYALRL